MSDRTAPAHKTAEVFAENLRQLVAAEPSISAVCRALDINRTQFNRYLSGEAHPRPEVLKKICAYFNYDARILLQSLAEIDTALPAIRPVEIDSRPFLELTLNFDHNRMPDGLYRMILPSFTDPTGVYFHLIRLFTLKNGGKGVHWAVPRPFAELTGKSTLWQDRKSTGYCMQQADGVSMIMASHFSRLYLMFFVSPGYRGHSHVYTGYAALTQARGIDQAQVQPLFIERPPDTCKAMLAARRQNTDFGQELLTDLQRHYLET